MALVKSIPVKNSHRICFTIACLKVNAYFTKMGLLEKDVSFLQYPPKKIFCGISGNFLHFVARKLNRQDAMNAKVKV